MKRYCKRWVSLLFAACLLLLSLAGCGGKSGTALDPGKPVTVTVWNYYNGDQLAAFDQLVEEFNATVGAEKGVVVMSVSQGDISTLADSLLAAVDGKAGAEDPPTLASVYSETGYILDQQGQLAALDPYFTEEELSAYVPGFLDEGRFGANNAMMLFPICKSTEVFTANETDWADFAAATGITLESLQTKEDLTAAAAAYYEWTDSLTPETPEDGKALYGRDSMANYIYIGSYQLGHEIFRVENGKLTVDMDRDAFKTLWDNYYVPYINGYFGAYANFRSEDAKTGKILALTSSSSSMGYLPTKVTLENDETHDIQLYTSQELTFQNAVTDAVVQQGASFCLLKSTEAEQEGAVEFLKWFTEADRNMTFALMSGYSPVTQAANDEDALRAAFSGDTSTAKGQIVWDALLLSADAFQTKTAYASKPFAGGKDVRALMGSTMQDIADADRAAVVEAIAAGVPREEAVAPYCTDAYFDAWFQGLCAQVSELTGA